VSSQSNFESDVLPSAGGADPAPGHRSARDKANDFAPLVGTIGALPCNAPLRTGPLRIRTGSQTPLFLTHDGYGNELYFQALTQWLPMELPVYGLPPLPLNQPRPQAMEAMAARMIELIRQVQPVGPYRIAGWSFGGVLAYEMAQQLLDQHQVVEFLGLLDSLCPDPEDNEFIGARTAANVLAGLCAPRPAWSACRSAAPESADEPDSFERFAELFDHSLRSEVLPENLRHLSPQDAYTQCLHLDLNTRVMHAYRPRRSRIPVHLLLASVRPADWAIAPEWPLGWASYVSRDLLKTQRVAGSHETMMQFPHIKELGRTLAASLAAAAP
jgi:arthrofactin-type cyclic lipopeptide synthetase C